MAALLVIVAGALAPGAAAAEELLRAAWVTAGNGIVTADAPRYRVDTPVDLRILDAAAERAGLGVVVTPMSREAAEAALAAGTADLMLPSADAPPPAPVVYRTQADVLLCAAALPRIEGQGIDALSAAYGRGWRVAMVRDASYPAAVAAVAAAAPAERTPRFGDAAAAVTAVVAGEADCVAAPRLALLDAVAAAPGTEAAVARKGTAIGAAELRLRFATGVAPATVARLDAALAAMRDDGSIAALVTEAGRPVLLRFAVATRWFAWLDIIGTIAFALSGVLIARSEGFSFLGAFVLAGLPAVGGGVVRDLLLGRRPIGILADPLPLTLVIVTVVVAYLAVAAARRLRLPPAPRAFAPAALLEVTDAAGLAAFTVIGVTVAVGTGAEPLWLWGPLAAALGGAGGGILRDLLRAGCANPALRTSFYAEVCVLWGAAFTAATLLFLREDAPALVRIAVGVTVLGAFLTRMAVAVLGIRSPRF